MNWDELEESLLEYKTPLQKVYEWQEIFGRQGHIVADKPRLIDVDTAKFRKEFFFEEAEEYLEAVETEDLVKTFDALLDLQFFLYGTVAIHGLQDVWEDGLKAVTASNFSKLGEDGKPVIREFDGKVTKGPNFSPPEAILEELLNAYRQD